MAPEPATILALIQAAHPSFRNAHDAVAYVVHAGLVASGLRLIAVGAQAESQASTAAPDGRLPDSSIEGWNDGDEGVYSFRYQAGEEAISAGKGAADRPFTVVLKALALGDLLLIDVAREGEAASGDTAPLHSEIRVAEFAVIDGAPSPIYARQFGNLEGLLACLNRDIWQPIFERWLQKGDNQGASATSETSSAAAVSRPRVEAPPGEERRGYPAPRMPQFGGDDLLPGGLPRDLPHIIGPGGAGGIGGGMLLGPNDPRWGSGVSFPQPPRGLPPGARFDPYGPPRLGGFNPDFFQTGRPSPSRRPPMHPDLEPFRDEGDLP
eukprot:TRINITY_DN5147_c0_g2_i1.p1 TRINITY_DN5147_c0_g2~~TRINITY_DN5147_c0_g2_i1.p1  ORF type:complete len:323 (+),score=59.89 TRINITY_DN5147_c0_g2_i1:247-1215(+)